MTGRLKKASEAWGAQGKEQERDITNLSPNLGPLLFDLRADIGNRAARAEKDAAE